MSVIDPAMTGWKRKVMRVIFPLNVLMLAAGFVLLCVPAVPVRLALTEIACGALALVTARGPSILAWIAALAGRDRMSRADVAQWQSARSLPDVGEMTARWLEGGISSQPGYQPGCGPDEETLPLVPLLARLNRGGFVTSGSQPAFDGDGSDGFHWRQRAAVEGFAGDDMASRLMSAATAAGLTVIAFPPASLPRWRYRYDRAVAVTRTDGCDPACPTRHADGCDYTWFGTQVPRRHVRHRWIGYGICHPDAVAALRSAWQVTIIDPQWGRQDRLWPALAEFARISTGATT